MILWIVVSCIGLLAVLMLLIYNRLVTLRNRCQEAWAQIDVQLKKRADLVPNLVETVKGYAAHEKAVLENVTKARAMMQSAGNDIGRQAEAANMLTGALKSLFAVTENYPELKANQSFLQLQNEIAAIEANIAYARQFFNETVRMYNEYQQLFPGVLFASLFGHAKKVYFEIDETERKAPQIKF